MRSQPWVLPISTGTTITFRYRVHLHRVLSDSKVLLEFLGVPQKVKNSAYISCDEESPVPIF